jgi:hypothetical protein
MFWFFIFKYFDIFSRNSGRDRCLTYPPPPLKINIAHTITNQLTNNNSVKHNYKVL